MTWPVSSFSPSPTPDCDRPPHPTSVSEVEIPIYAPSAPTNTSPPIDPIPGSCIDDPQTNIAGLSDTPQPDPFLDSQPEIAALAAGLPPVSDPPEIPRPRTSEVFRDVLSQPLNETGDSWIAASQAWSETNPKPSPFHVLPTAPLSMANPTDLDDPLSSGEYEPASNAWARLILISYSSAITLALVWLLWSGRSIRPTEPPDRDQPTAESSTPADITPASRPPDPPLPPENCTSIGKPIKLGDLEITPTQIRARPIELIRSIDPYEVRKNKLPSLVLRISFKNLSTKHTFAPLDRAFVREPASRVDESYIETANRPRIDLFPLALDSEWSIRGQDFSSLEPGQSLVSILVTAPVEIAQLGDDQTWRVRLRTGPYETNVLGVQFSKADVTGQSTAGP